MKWKAGVVSPLLVLCVLIVAPPVRTALAWQDNLDGTANSNDAPTGVAIDRNGNIIVCGGTYNFADGRGVQQFTVAKLSGATGIEIWRAIIGDGSEGSAYAVSVDPDGNVVAVGSVLSPQLRGRFTTVKLDGSTGTELWRHVTDPGGDYYNGTIVWTVDVDHEGNVVAGGRFVYPGSYRFFVTKLSSLDGREIWRRETVLGPGMTEVRALKVDAVGDVFAAGTVGNNFYSNDLFVAKLSGSTGNPKWLYRSATTGNHNNYATSVALDRAGDFVVAGSKAAVLSDNSMFVIKFAGANGTALWSKEIALPALGYGVANSVAVDSAGDVITAGLQYGVETPGSAFWVVKLAGQTGRDIWMRRIQGSANWSDQGYGVAIDSRDDVIAVGETQNTTTSQDFTTVKLAGSTGEQLWRTDVSGTEPGGWPGGSNDDEARFLAVDSCQNVVAVGRTENVSTREDMTIVKLSGLSGNAGKDFKSGPCRPPRATISSRETVECSSPSGGLVILDGSSSSDPDSSPGTNDDIKDFEWYEDYGLPTQRLVGTEARLEVILPLGAHAVALKVIDLLRGSDMAHATLTVVDTVPPMPACPDLREAECSAPGGSQVDLVVAPIDACSSTIAVSNSRTGGGVDASGFYRLGTTEVTFETTDASGNHADCTSRVLVRDTTPPSLTLALSPTVLWPPNQRMVEVRAAWQVGDICDPAAHAVLASVSSSEPDYSGDIQDALYDSPDSTVLLRARRSGAGPGRIYTVVYTAIDASANSASAPGFIIVPHDMR